MKITTSVTKIELDPIERDALRQAIIVLNNVNKIIEDSDTDYVVDRADMDIYNRVYDEIDRIEDYISME